MGSYYEPPTQAREFNPSSYPPFPQFLEPCIELETISLQSLSTDAFERARLLSICRDNGFFYLDVVDSMHKDVVQYADAVVANSQDFFHLPLEEKMKFSWGQKPNSLLGYKPAGFVKGDAFGTKGDTVEFMNVGKDDIFDEDDFERVKVEIPALFGPPYRSLGPFAVNCHVIAREILKYLANELGLDERAFEQMHDYYEPAASDSHVRMARGPARVTDTDVEIQTPGHTDFGSVTLLFNWLGGLQIWSESNHGASFDNAVGSDLGPESGRAGEWQWVRPKPGYIVVNLGDCIVKSTGGLLCAGRHRVVPAPGEQGKHPRYSLVYFLRPVDNCVVKRLEGGMIPPLEDDEVEEELTAAEWSAKQLKGLKEGAKKD